MKWFRKVVDEREESELRHIESRAYFVFVLGLGIAIIVQSLVGMSFEHVLGEFIVLLVGVGWVMAGYFRKGLWDYRAKPGIKAYVGTGFFTALIYMIISTSARYFRSETELLICLKYAAVNSVIIFSAVFSVTMLFGTVTKRRRKKLEQKFEDSD